eukprot:TRINITY_DN30746_c0_g1_i1.p1 TRINITY_DN30746_c0_g1~~TRINITY_DN30746_c0_g1_i1.p1  ORF type:complete len:525 (+),score=174.23 TRINITY_DN30746_c0_g1_i1:84-1577(+)
MEADDAPAPQTPQGHMPRGAAMEVDGAPPRQRAAPDAEGPTCQFYVQCVRAELLVSSGQLSKVDEALSVATLRKYWRKFAHCSSDPFVHQCVLRAVKVQLARCDAPSDAEVFSQILGSLVFGDTADSVAAEAIEIFFNKHTSVAAVEGALRDMVRDQAVPLRLAPLGETAAAFAPLLGWRHCALRLATVYSVALQRCALNRNAVTHIVHADVLGNDRPTLPGLLRAMLAARPTEEGIKEVAVRCAALRLMSDMCFASPQLCIRLVPALKTAVFAEGSETAREVALGLLWDLAYLVPHLGLSVTEEDPAEGSLAFLPEFLLCPYPRLQFISVLGAARLLLYGECDAPEMLLAKLAVAAVSPHPNAQQARRTGQAALRHYAKGGEHQEELANAVCQLCVESFSKGLLSPTAPTAPLPEVALLMRAVGAHMHRPLEMTVQNNIADFFGRSVDVRAVRVWLGISGGAHAAPGQGAQGGPGGRGQAAGGGGRGPLPGLGLRQ